MIILIKMLHRMKNLMKNYNITQIHLLDINDIILPRPGDQPPETLAYLLGFTDD